MLIQEEHRATLRNRPGAAIRAGRHKLIKRFDNGSVELYDLSDDLGEEHDLTADKPDLAKALFTRLEGWLKATGANLPTPRSRPQ